MILRKGLEGLVSGIVLALIALIVLLVKKSKQKKLPKKAAEAAARNCWICEYCHIENSNEKDVSVCHYCGKDKKPVPVPGTDDK